MRAADEQRRDRAISAGVDRGEVACGRVAVDADGVREPDIADLLDARAVLVAPEALRRRRRGAEPEHRPPGLRALGGVYTYIVNSGLPKALIDLVFLRASQINGCAYCIDMHSRDLLKGGIAVEKMMLVSAWREAGDIFTDKEKAALQWAEAITLISETHAPDEAFAAVSAQFQPKEISDLTLAIGVINTYNRLSIGFRRPPGGEPAA